jgi:hypothetical protein
LTVCELLLGIVALSPTYTTYQRSYLFFPIRAVVVWGDGEQTNEIVIAECRCSA